MFLFLLFLVFGCMAKKLPKVSFKISFCNVGTTIKPMVSSAACYQGGPGFKSWQDRELLMLNKKELLI